MACKQYKHTFFPFLFSNEHEMRGKLPNDSGSWTSGRGPICMLIQQLMAHFRLRNMFHRDKKHPRSHSSRNAECGSVAS